MEHGFFDPPAISRTAADEAFLKVKSIVKKTHDDVIELGKALIAAKAVCPHGQWEKRCRKAGIAPSTARWTIAKTELQIANVSDLNFFDEEMEDDATKEVTSGSGTINVPSGTMPTLPNGVSAPEPEGNNVPNLQIPDSQRPSTPAATLKCRPCRVGSQKLNCPDCRAMNAPATNGQPSPAPSIPPPAAWSTSAPPPDEAPPAEGEDNAQIKKIDRAIRNASKLAQEILRREVDPKAVQKDLDALKRILGDLRGHADAPVKPCEPRAAKCKDCERDCLWVVTENAKIMLVEAEKSYRGKYNLKDGIAHYVEWTEERKWELYQLHTQNCPKRKKK